MPLSSSEWIAILIGIGGFITGLSTTVISIRKQRAESNLEDRKQSVTEEKQTTDILRDLIKELRTDLTLADERLDRYQKRIDELVVSEAKCQAMTMQLNSKVELLEVEIHCLRSELSVMQDIKTHRLKQKELD